MNLTANMERVRIETLAKRLSLIAGQPIDNQQAYHIINNLLGIHKINKYHYDWDEYFHREDAGDVAKALDFYFNDTSFKIKPNKTTAKKEWPEPPRPNEEDMDFVSRELLKKDEVWNESKRRINRIIREELLRIC